MAVTNLGKKVNFGFTGTDGIAVTWITSKGILQSADYSTTSDKEEIRDAIGELVSDIRYNPGAKASLEYVVTGATAGDAITNSVLPEHAVFVNITACASQPLLVKTNWRIDGDPKITHSNTGAAKVSLSLVAHAGIAP